MSVLLVSTRAVFACHSKACAPPPAGRGGSSPADSIVDRRVAGVGKNLSEPDAGFTMSTRLRSITTGFSVAINGSDRLIDASTAYLEDGSVNPVLRNLIKDRLSAALSTKPPKGTKVAIGGWHNPEDGKLEVNVSVVFPKNRQADAIKFARKNNQISIARLHDPFEIINTGGTGGDRALTSSVLSAYRSAHV